MATATAPGAIIPTALYPLSDLKKVSGVGDWGLRQMRRNGLQVRYVGGHAGFVLGQSFIDHVLTAGDAEHANAGPRQ